MDNATGKNFVLSCCSTADLTRGHFDRRNISVLCFHYSLGGVEHEDDFGESIPYEEFYARMAKGEMTKTSQPNVDEFVAHFTPILESGKDILHVCLSSGLSGVYNSACLARDALKEQFPDRTIHVVDSLGASSGYGLIMETLADKRDEGATLDELYGWVEANKLRMHHWFFSTDLTFYIRGGRISKTAGAVGQALNICPLLNMNNQGRLIPRNKVRSKKRVIKEIEKRMEQHAEGGLDYSGKCFISQSACREDARAVADIVESRFKNLNGTVDINYVGTTIGSHTGPGTVALFFWGDKRGD
jgi:DegV family protein with EDD domain